MLPDYQGARAHEPSTPKQRLQRNATELMYLKTKTIEEPIMPIYEYVCRDCDAAFEKMVPMAKADEVDCASCGSDKTERKFSVFGVASSQANNACAGGACDLPTSPCAAAGPGGGCHGCPGMG